MNTAKIHLLDAKPRTLPQIPLLLPKASFKYYNLQPLVLFLLLLLFWFLMPAWMSSRDQTVGSVDQGIWLLIVLSLISFFLVTGLCWWLLQHAWHKLGLPSIHKMVSQFNTLSLWQQLSFYWLSFALLLLAALLALTAIC